MIARTMVFAALVAAPAASFLCGERFLLFFCLFPAAAAVELKMKYFRNIALLAFAPFLFLMWAIASGNDTTFMRSFRWISALAAGSYFAGALGTTGIASVLRGMGSSFPLAKTLAETMESAGPAIRSAGKTWRSRKDLPTFRRVTAALSESLSAEPERPSPPSVKAVPVSVSIVSWIFLLGTVAGGFR